MNFFIKNKIRTRTVQEQDKNSDWTKANVSSDYGLNLDEISDQEQDKNSDWTKANVSSDYGLNLDEISDQE